MDKEQCDKLVDIFTPIVERVSKKSHPNCHWKVEALEGWKNPPSVILVGHKYDNLFILQVSSISKCDKSGCRKSYVIYDGTARGLRDKKILYEHQDFNTIIYYLKNEFFKEEESNTEYYEYTIFDFMEEQDDTKTRG